MALWCKENKKRERSDWPSKGSIIDESTAAELLDNESVAVHFAIPAPRAEHFSSFQQFVIQIPQLLTSTSTTENTHQ